MDPLLAALRGAHTVPQFEWTRRGGIVYTYKSGVGAHAGPTGATLGDLGWTTTSLVLAGGAGADVPNASWTSTDISGGAPALDWGTPGYTLTDASTDLLQSPAIFADPMGFWEAGKLLGSTKPPLKFIAEFWGALTVDSANETRSGFGLVEAGGTAGTAADTLAWIYSDGTNLRIENGAATAPVYGTLIAVTEQLLLHRLVITRSDVAQTLQTIQWLTSPDGITFTSRATVLQETDLLPCSFGMYANTTNRPALYGTAFFYYI